MSQLLLVSLSTLVVLVEATVELSRQYTYNVQLAIDSHSYSYDTKLGILRIAVQVLTTGWEFLQMDKCQDQMW